MRGLRSNALKAIRAVIEGQRLGRVRSLIHVWSAKIVRNKEFILTQMLKEHKEAQQHLEHGTDRLEREVDRLKESIQTSTTSLETEIRNMERTLHEPGGDEGVDSGIRAEARAARGERRLELRLKELSELLARVRGCRARELKESERDRRLLADVSQELSLEKEAREQVVDRMRHASML